MLPRRPAPKVTARRGSRKDSIEIAPVVNRADSTASARKRKPENGPDDEAKKEQPSRPQPYPAAVHTERGDAIHQYVEIPQGHDEYGAELGRDARFWRTYVKETDDWDYELVDGWNRLVPYRAKSLDVILIFAALFSAILSAFVIESSKSLQQDQTKLSADSLMDISRTLLLVLNKGNIASLPVTPAPAETKFQSSRSAVCVNTLWFLSLSITVSVSLVAMLAKEWCYSFMSGRTGQPCLQARRRQQRWDGLVRWRMRELLIFLPTLIHLALLLFAIGLSIFLWDMHFGVAIPVVFVTLASVGFYGVSTLLPLCYEFCPYGTTISNLAKQLYRALSEKEVQPGEENPDQDIITSQALHWMIVNCEVPRSVDIALQAIAGANKNLPRQLLQECDAEMLIYRRLTASSSYAGDYDLSMSLYARALSYLRSNTQEAHRDSRPSQTSGNLQVSIWAMQSRNESNVVSKLADGGLIPTEHNLSALKIGSTAASDCLNIFSNRHQGDLYTVDLATSLLVQQLCDRISLHPAALLSLVRATEMLLSCALVHCKPHEAVVFPMKLVQAFVEFSRLPKENTERDAVRSYIGVLLTSFAVSQHDYPGWKHRPPHNHASRAERAIEIVGYYASLVNHIDQGAAYTLIHFGLLELLHHSDTYQLTSENYETITRAFALLPFHANKAIYTFPLSESFNLSHRTLADTPPSLLIVSEGAGTFANEARVVAYLQAMRDVHSSEGVDSLLIEQADFFVLESLCRVQSVALRDFCLTIMNRVPLPSLSNKLAWYLDKRAIVPLLLCTQESTDHVRATFATGQLWLISTILLKSSHDLSIARQIILAPFLKSGESVAVTKQLVLICVALASQYEHASQTNDEVSGPLRPGGIYFNRLLECILLERGESKSTPRMQRINNVLQYVPKHLRGLNFLES